MAEHQLSPAWKVQLKPGLLIRRYEFATYSETLKSLDAFGSTSEHSSCRPGLNFSRTHVSVTIAPLDEQLDDLESGFTKLADALARNAG